MTEAIIVALIAATGSVIGQALLLKKSQREQEVKQEVLNERTDRRLQAIEDELSELKKQVKEHNGLKQDIVEIKTEIRMIKEMHHD